MELVRAGLGRDHNLAAGALAVFRAVGVSQYIELAYRIHAQQLLAGSAWLHVVFRSSGKFNPSQKEQILLRTIPGNRKIVSGGGIRYTGPTRLQCGEINDARVQRKQQIVAAPVERKILYLLLPHQSGDVLGGDVDHRRVSCHLRFFAHDSKTQTDVGAGVLTQYETNSRANSPRKAILADPNFILTKGK